MIIVMEREATDVQVAAVEAKIRTHGLEVHVSRGTERTLIGAIGDERKLDPEMFETMEGVEKSMHIVKPYKLVAREWHKANTVINAGGIPIGGKTVQVIAGPCSVETDAADACGGGGRARGRRAADARRRVQAAHVAVRVPGQGHRGPEAPQGRRGELQAAGRHRAHGRADARRVPGARRRRDPDRHAQHAELRPAEGRGPGDDAGDPEARHERDDQRVADGGRIHRRRRQSQHHLLRARHPHVRDGLPQRARRHRDRGDEARDAPARDRRSLACGRQGVDGAGAVVRGRGRGRRRAPDRNPSDAEGGVVRCRPGAHAGRVRRADAPARRAWPARWAASFDAAGTERFPYGRTRGTKSRRVDRVKASPTHRAPCAADV